MKIVKEGEVRRREILIAARELFVKKGYDRPDLRTVYWTKYAYLVQYTVRKSDI